MSKHIAFLSIAAAVLGAAALPGGASAADYYGGGDPPLAYHGRDDAFVDGGRAPVEFRGDPRPAYRRAPGPVVFDERDPGPGYGGPRDGGPAFGEPGWRRPVPVGRPFPGYGYGRPAAFAPRPQPFDGDGFRPAPLYRPAAVPAGPAYGEDFGGPDVGCTTEEAQSTTPAGWRKIVTHRTCYRR